MKTMSFSELTKERSNYTIEDGIYKGKIVTAQAKVGNKGDDQISLKIDLYNEEGKRVQGIFDTILEAPDVTENMTLQEKRVAELLSNKLYRFLRATKITIPEKFNLKTILDNIHTAQEFKVDITTQKQKEYQPRNVVNIAKGMYYTLEDDIIIEEEIDTADAF